MTLLFLSVGVVIEMPRSIPNFRHFNSPRGFSSVSLTVGHSFVGKWADANGTTDRCHSRWSRSGRRSDDQKVSLRAKRICRSVACADVISLKPLLLMIEPSARRVGEEAFAPGLLKAGVLVRLKTSVRN